MIYIKVAAAAAGKSRKGRWLGFLLAGGLTVSMVSCGAMGFGSHAEQALMVQQGLAGGNCAPAGPVVPAGALGTASDEQLRNAQTIVNVAPSGDMHAARIAIATAIVESGLRNLDYGDRDSIGLFQQRPSAGWGTVAQIMDPIYSVGKFYTALFALPNWATMGDGAAAQAVQRSAFPGRYADVMGQADVWLAQVGTPSGAQVAATTAPCIQQVNNGIKQDPAGAQSGFTDGPSIGYTTGRSVADAIAFAHAQESSGNNIWYRRCLAFVTQATGGWVGVPYAIDAFYVGPADRRHAASSPEGRQPSPGAALFYETGSRAGHVALYLGGGMIASNDILVNGQISIVPANLIETKWGSTYVGWAMP